MFRIYFPGDCVYTRRLHYYCAIYKFVEPPFDYLVVGTTIMTYQAQSTNTLNSYMWAYKYAFPSDLQAKNLTFVTRMFFVEWIYDSSGADADDNYPISLLKYSDKSVVNRLFKLPTASQSINSSFNLPLPAGDACGLYKD